MNPEALLKFFIENGIRWVESQRDVYRPSARDLTETERSVLAPFFDTNTLNLAKIKMVPVIENPGFYSELEDMGIPVILDFSFAAGITFKDTIVVSRPYLRQPSPATALIFHELVHVVQYQILGVREFIERYIAAWAENGFDYSAIPLEVEAYRLGRRFEKNQGQTFSVIAEVRGSLGVKAQSEL